MLGFKDFYPRSPCGERRILLTLIIGFLEFLSTLSLRRATCYSFRYPTSGWYFYPRSPCGERHADTKNTSFHKLFLSTLSLRRATYSRLFFCCNEAISIHALLAESDISVLWMVRSHPSFLSTLSLRRATAKVHKTVGHFCAYETNFMGIASSC